MYMYIGCIYVYMYVFLLCMYTNIFYDTYTDHKLTCYNKATARSRSQLPLDPWISFRPKNNKFSKSTLELQSALRPNTNVAIPTSSRHGIPPGVHTYMHHTTLMATESHDGPSPSFQNIPYPAHTIFISSKDVMPRF